MRPGNQARGMTCTLENQPGTRNPSGNYTSFRRWASSTRASRLPACNFSRALRTWFCTVCALSCRQSAIAATRSPAARSATTSSSRGVSTSTPLRSRSFDKTVCRPWALPPLTERPARPGPPSRRLLVEQVHQHRRVRTGLRNDQRHHPDPASASPMHTASIT